MESNTEVVPTPEEDLLVRSQRNNAETQSQWQHQFYYLNSPTTYKYVNELWNAIDNGNYTLYLVVKLEWRSNGKWKVAGEPRYSTVDVTGSVQLFGGYDGNFGSTYIDKHLTYNSLIGPWWIVLKSDYLVYAPGTYWDITLNGNIYQRIILDPNSGWNCMAYPLW